MQFGNSDDILNVYEKEKIMSNVDFGELFNKLCEESGKTNTEIAQGLHVDKATIGRWRNGERSPKLSSLQEIAEYFNVDIHIFTKQKETKKEDSIPRSFINSQEAMLFIIKNPIMMKFGGYDIHHMNDQELLDTAKQISDYMSYVINKKTEI